MNDTQPYQLESKEPLQEENNSDCFEEKTRNHRREREENREY